MSYTKQYLCKYLLKEKGPWLKGPFVIEIKSDDI